MRIGLRGFGCIMSRATRLLLLLFVRWCVPGYGYLPSWRFSPTRGRACHPPLIGLRDNPAAILLMAVITGTTALSIRAHGLARPRPLPRNCLPLDAVSS